MSSGLDPIETRPRVRPSCAPVSPRLRSAWGSMEAVAYTDARRRRHKHTKKGRRHGHDGRRSRRHGASPTHGRRSPVSPSMFPSVPGMHSPIRIDTQLHGGPMHATSWQQLVAASPLAGGTSPSHDGSTSCPAGAQPPKRRRRRRKSIGLAKVPGPRGAGAASPKKQTTPEGPPVMTLNVHIIPRPGGTPLKAVHMKVGQGEQTFKWLALAAGTRVRNARQAGVIRQRELTGAAVGSFVPLRIDTAKSLHGKGANIKPTDKLKDKLDSGSDVYITLMTKAMFDQRGSLSVDSWHDDAFKHRNLAAAAKREARQKDASHRRTVRMRMGMLRTMAREVGSRQAMQHQLAALYNDKDNEEDMFEDDWAAMKMPRRMSTDQQEELKEWVRLHFHDMRTLYRIYSNAMGSTTAGSLEAFNMSLNEFTAFAHDARVGVGVIRRLPIRRAFRQAVKGVGDEGEAMPSDTPPHKRLGRHRTRPRLSVQNGEDNLMFMKREHFIDGLMLLCGYRHLCTRSDVFSLQDVPHVSATMLEPFWESLIAPRVKRLHGDRIRQELQGRKVAKLLYREMALLKQVFKQFSHPVGRGGARAMDQEELITFLATIGIYDRKLARAKATSSALTPLRRPSHESDSGRAQGHFGRSTAAVKGEVKTVDDGVKHTMNKVLLTDGEILRRRDVCQALLLSQSEDEDVAGLASATMVFSEFVEAIARVADMKWGKAHSDGLHEEFALMLDAIAVWDHFTSNSKTRAVRRNVPATPSGGGAASLPRIESGRSVRSAKPRSPAPATGGAFGLGRIAEMASRRSLHHKAQEALEAGGGAAVPTPAEAMAAAAAAAEAENDGDAALDGHAAFVVADDGIDAMLELS